jgi:hypothetical protein
VILLAQLFQILWDKGISVSLSRHSLKQRLTQVVCILQTLSGRSVVCDPWAFAVQKSGYSKRLS